MARRTSAVCIGLLLAALTLAGCGSSAKRAGSAPSVGTTPSVGTASSAPTSSQSAPPPQAHAEVPAIFDVLASGSVSPPTVSVPAALAVELTVVSRDGHAHTAVLRGSPAHALAVPGGGRASLLVTGLKPGRYVLAVDGGARATLVVGVQPGP